VTYFSLLYGDSCSRCRDVICTSIHTGVCKKVVHTRLTSVGFRSWSRFLAVSLQVMWVINPAVGCYYFPPGLPPQPLRGPLPVSLLGKQRHDGCEQFAYDCYPTASRLRFEPRPFCAWVQHDNHSATEPLMVCDDKKYIYQCVGAIDDRQRLRSHRRNRKLQMVYFFSLCYD